MIARFIHLVIVQTVESNCRAARSRFAFTWRRVDLHDYSSVERAQDLDGPCTDLRANEVWVIAPAEYLRNIPGMKRRMQLADGERFVLWRGAPVSPDAGSDWHCRYAGGLLTLNQPEQDIEPFKLEMAEGCNIKESEVGALAAAAVARYHTFCADHGDPGTSPKSGERNQCAIAPSA